MISSLQLLLCSFVLFESFAAGSPILTISVPRYFQRSPVTPANISVATVKRELGAALSRKATIYGPKDADFSLLTRRWDTVPLPDIEIVVQPGVESDVSKIVDYCDHHSIKFLAVNRGHGFSGALAEFKGLQIDMKHLNGISIQRDKQYAVLQGGVWGRELVGTLWDAGFVTPTGSSECVGYAGPALGGGHGRLEGLYGLIIDNILHMNVVLANGSHIGVNSTSHEDLFWAMRGAGHNFGIVTSLKVKIYPALHPTWHWHNYVWKQDKLEKVFTELNKLQDNGKTPVLLGSTYGSIGMNTSISKTEAVLQWQFAYYGSAEEAEKVLQPFNAIPAAWSGQGDVPYPEIVIPQFTSLSQCPSGNRALSHLLTRTWNVTAERQNYINYNKNAAIDPAFAETAVIFYEGYSTAGVTKVASDSTAYPHRNELHLAIFQGIVPPGSSLDQANAWAKQVWNNWRAGQPRSRLATYVNYSIGPQYGTETLESIYGAKDGRLARLRKLKAQYDPHNRFVSYVPLVPEYYYGK